MYDEEIEKAVLYYIIFDKADYLIQEADFVADRNRKIARAINELRQEKQDISIISVKSKIRANQHQVLEYISKIGDNIYGSNADELYRKLIELSQKRKVFNLAHEILKNIEHEDIAVYSQKIIKELDDITNQTEKEPTIAEQLVDTVNQITENWKNRNDYSLYTGMLDLDKKICGLHNQELTIIRS